MTSGRHGEVAQDEVEGAVRGGVEGLAGVEGENVVGPSPLELPLRHEQWGACVRAREGCNVLVLSLLTRSIVASLSPMGSIFEIKINLLLP